MKSNVGKTDAAIRTGLGLAVLGLGAFFGSWWGLFGFIPLFTGIVERCPAYSLLGISTCKRPLGQHG